MGKLSNKLIDSIRRSWNLKDKLSAAWTAGSRIVPSRSSKNDKAYQIRFDAGELINNQFRKVYVQVNSQATSTALKTWVRKNGTHANLAEGQYDTLAPDQDAETERLVEDIKDQMDRNLG